MAIEVKEFRTPGERLDVEGYCLLCTTSGLIFGPSLDAERGAADAEAFLQWLIERGIQPRAVKLAYLDDCYRRYCEANEPAQ